MVNLEFRKNIGNVKCYTQKLLFMANSRKEKSTKTDQDDKIASKQQVDKNTVSIAPGAPLAAKDSEWIGFRTDLVATENRLPAEYLFPDVQFNETTQSTTVITKLLVGKKADFSFLPPKPEKSKINQLTAVQEQSKEEYHPSDTDVSVTGKPLVEERPSVTDVEYYDDEDDEPKRATHTKRRKKRSDLKVITDDVSSVSILPSVRRKSGSRIRHSDTAKAKQPTLNTSSIVLSNDADDEYMTQSEENCTEKQLLKKY